MGGGNPVKKAIQVVTKAVTGGYAVDAIKEGAQVVGAKGVADLATNYNQTVEKGFEMAYNMASGKDKEMKAEAEAAAKEQAAQAQRENEAEQARETSERNAAIEKERMAAGSASRTLLTGPAGLEDEEDGVSISRKYLSARR